MSRGDLVERSLEKVGRVHLVSGNSPDREGESVIGGSIPPTLFGNTISPTETAGTVMRR